MSSVQEDIFSKVSTSSLASCYVPWWRRIPLLAWLLQCLLGFPSSPGSIVANHTPCGDSSLPTDPSYLGKWVCPQVFRQLGKPELVLHYHDNLCFNHASRCARRVTHQPIRTLLPRARLLIPHAPLHSTLRKVRIRDHSKLSKVFTPYKVCLLCFQTCTSFSIRTEGANMCRYMFGKSYFIYSCIVRWVLNLCIILRQIYQIDHYNPLFTINLD